MNEDQARILQGLVANPAFSVFYVSLLEYEAERIRQQLDKFPDERPAPRYSDDYLRGYGRGLRFAIHRGEDLLKECEQAALDRQPPGPEPDPVGSPYREPEVQG